MLPNQSKPSIKRLLEIREKHVAAYRSDFVFSITYDPNDIKEIEEMGDEFTSKYSYEVSTSPIEIITLRKL